MKLNSFRRSVHAAIAFSGIMLISVGGLNAAPQTQSANQLQTPSTSSIPTKASIVPVSKPKLVLGSKYKTDNKFEYRHVCDSGSGSQYSWLLSSTHYEKVSKHDTEDDCELFLPFNFGTKHEGSASCPDGKVVSKIKYQKTLWKSTQKAVSYIELYCASLADDGAINTASEEKVDSFGFNSGASLTTKSCSGRAVAGIRIEKDALSVKCLDAFINEEGEAEAGIFHSGSSYAGTGAQGDTYSITYDLIEMAFEEESNVCLQGINEEEHFYESAGAITGIDFKYQRSENGAFSNDNAYVYSLVAQCRKVITK